MQKTIPVIIVGGGPVGLTMALCLAKQGIQSTLIEKHESVSTHPKARGVNGRSMEVFRHLGLGDELTQHEMAQEAHRFIWLENLQEKEITRVEATIDYQKYSPCERAMISQDKVEEVLRAKAKATLLVDLRFNTVADKVTQTTDGVRVDIVDRNTNEKTVLAAQYLVAADGAYSSVRESLGINMQGVANLGDYCSVFCEMDLNKYVSDRPAVGYLFTKGDVMGRMLLANKCLTHWLAGLRLDAEAGQIKEQFTDEVCIEMVKNIIKDDRIDIKFISKGFWTMAALIAESFQVGRIFLAGDAAHRLPPTGGFGMNTGIQDAHNLAWKLAYVIKGVTDESLLNSYEKERAPIAKMNMKWSSKNAKRFSAIYEAIYANDWDKAKALLKEQSTHINSIQLDLGFTYGSDYASSNDNFKQVAKVGGRAPHCWLQKENKIFSTLDLFNEEYVLLCDIKATHWQSYFASLKTLPLSIYTIGYGGDFSDIHHDFNQLYDLSTQGAVLIRPDGHVVWHSYDEKTPYKNQLF